MSAHTPGPWKLHFWAENVAVSSDRPKPRDCETVATVFRGPEQHGNETEERRTADANARLIAAAPDLLAALERFVTEDDGPETWRMARAAIAKARGEP